MPSEQKMRFFTPELYRRYNSPDDAVALAADEEWEQAIARYGEYLAQFQGRMPSQVAKLAELCLHDGEILLRQEQQQPLDLFWFDEPPGRRLGPIWYGAATLAVKLGDELVTLFYFLYDHIAEQPAPPDWPFSKQREHWLYDEIHWQPGERGRFTHLILLSSGVVLSIPFSTVMITSIPVAPADAESGKQSA
jgi:hypothetical protein